MKAVDCIIVVCLFTKYLTSGIQVPVRLVGGSTESEGRLELYYKETWGTVCDDSVTDNIAVVVCRSLGFPWNTSEVYGNAVYGPGSGPIWLDDVNCDGSEISIDECQHREWGTHNCNHRKDVSINCSPNDTVIRLVGGDTESEGRLEVYKFDKWGTVCDNLPNDNLAVVVCRSLRFPWNTSKVYGNAVYGPGSDSIWLGGVNCEGSETSIDDCRHSGWGTHNCLHREDVSINCSPNDTIIRLVGGDTESEGRLEVFKFGEWGTVCDYSPNDKLAVVVCRSLGFPCLQFGAWGTHNCYHGKDVSVNCSPNDTIIRLVGGDTESEGRLEVYKFGKWGTVCDDSVTDKLAAVVCRSLGLSWNTLEVYGKAVYGPGSGPIWLDDVNCEGSETSIDECQHRAWGTHNCDHREDVSINCSPNGTVRLVGGSTKYEGRLEVYYNGAWGTVCDDEINEKVSTVVCRTLGLPWTTSEVYGGAVYGQGSGPIWLESVKCEGTEARIQDCLHHPWGVHNCAHTEDSSINCLPSRGGKSIVFPFF